MFFPREFHEQRSLAGYSAQDCKESDTTEQLTHTQLHYLFCCSNYSRFVYRKYTQVGFSVPLTCLSLSVFFFLFVYLSTSLLPGTARCSRFILYFPVVKEYTCQCRRHRRLWFDLWVGKIPWRSRIIVWRIPGTEEPSGLPSMGSHRVGHDWSDLVAATAVVKEHTCQCRRHRRLQFDLWVGKIPWRGQGNPLQDYCLENSMDRGAWLVTVHGVAQSYDGARTHVFVLELEICLETLVLYVSM